jgi:hypothetical protein
MPVYPGCIVRAMSRHSSGVRLTEPPAHAPLYPPPSPDSVASRQPAGMPAIAEPPLKMSG